MENQNLATWDFGYIEERKAWARIVLGELFSMLPTGIPSSLVDFGGGAGSWCVAAQQLGVDHVLLVDQCPSSQVIKSLNNSHNFLWFEFDKGIPTVGRYDIAISIEVAEHLPDAQGKSLIRRLTETSNIILFAAAIPGQGGIGHINEQLHEYWHNLFLANGFTCHDILRWRLTTNLKLPWWIRQNIFVYSNACYPSLTQYYNHPHDLELIHSDNLRRLVDRKLDTSTIIRALPSALAASIARKIRK
jgi:hypothetical protein